MLPASMKNRTYCHPERSAAESKDLSIKLGIIYLQIKSIEMLPNVSMTNLTWRESIKKAARRQPFNKVRGYPFIFPQ